MTHVAYPVPFLSYLRGYKSASVRPYDPDTMTNTVEIPLYKLSLRRAAKTGNWLSAIGFSKTNLFDGSVERLESLETVDSNWNGV